MPRLPLGEVDGVLLSTALGVVRRPDRSRLGRCRPWRRGQPAPMPSATANAQIRSTYLAYPISASPPSNCTNEAASSAAVLYLAAWSGCGSRSDQVWVYAVVTRRPMAKSRVSQTTVFGALRPMLRTLHS